eukprot:gene13219-9468_t
MSDANSNNNANAANPTQGELKQDARDARLGGHMRKTVEENLRKQFQGLARQNCKEESIAFGKCAQENGAWVIFKCRELSNTMNKCMDRYYNEENFQQYLRDLKAAGKLPGQQPPQSQQH